jgi:hypothetical protein
MDEAETLEKFSAMVSGAPGEAVPQVDPEDVKAVWELSQEVKKDHPDGGVAIGMAIFEHTCKPGAVVKAVIYRANMTDILCSAAPEIMKPLLQDKLDAVIHTAATIPMEWLGVRIVRRGFPFDAGDFIRRVSEAA